MQFTDKTDPVQILLADNKLTKDIMIQLTVSTSFMRIELLYLSFQRTGYTPILTPLISLLRQQEMHNQQIAGGAENGPKTDREEKVDISELVRSISEELRLNYAVFLTLSEFYNWDMQFQNAPNPDAIGSPDSPLSVVRTNETHLWTLPALLTARSEEIVMLLLRRATHVSEHFYAFVPMDKSTFFQQLSAKAAVQEASSEASSEACSEASSEACYVELMTEMNSYLYDLLKHKLSLMFHAFPASCFDVLKEIAKNSLDYAYINQAHAFFAVCDSRGNPLMSRDGEFFLFLLFLQDLASSSHHQTTGQQFMKVDYFFLTPSSFQSASIHSQQVTLDIPQQKKIQFLFKSCFFYSLYHFIVSNGIGNTAEVRKFLTNENCCASAINVDLSMLLRVLPYLCDADREAIDAELLTYLRNLRCSLFDEYLVVNCDAYPCFVKLELNLVVKKGLKRDKVCVGKRCEP